MLQFRIFILDFLLWSKSYLFFYDFIGLNSNINGKANASHTHDASEIEAGYHTIDNSPVNNGGARDTSLSGELSRYASALKTLDSRVDSIDISVNTLDLTKQNASTAINTSNIGSQSVKYATSAGSATKVTGVVPLANGGTGQTSLAALKKQIFGWTTIGSTIGTNAISFSNYANYSEMQIVVYVADCCAYTVIPASEMAVNNWYYLLPGYWGTFEASVYITNKTIKISSVKYKEQEKASSATISIYAR